MSLTSETDLIETPTSSQASARLRASRTSSMRVWWAVGPSFDCSMRTGALVW